MAKHLTLQECLYNGFADIENQDPQSEVTLWAVRETFHRSGTWAYSWKEIIAVRNHRCIRGCEIKEGDTHFRYGSGFNVLRVCPSCTAMVLYFSRFWYGVPTAYFDHWDPEMQRPVNLADGLTKMNDYRYFVNKIRRNTEED